MAKKGEVEDPAEQAGSVLEAPGVQKSRMHSPFRSLLAPGILLLLCAAVLAATITSSAGPSYPPALVNLTYASYQGYYNTSSNLSIFKGIRYAAPPLGSLRWAKPSPPANTSGTITVVTDWPPRCPQSPQAPISSGFYFAGNEDCLFLSVFTPANTSSFHDTASSDGQTLLPVLFWIHGGGYGSGQGDADLSEMMATNGNGFISVVIQYRLGAFGFLSSAAFRDGGGVVNAGLWDIRFALEWVQEHIGAFGGDARRVTIVGESAGGGAVMEMALMDGGTLGSSLFRNAIVASPYLPQQWNYDGASPTDSYGRFVSAVGCAGGDGATQLACLRAADSLALQKASADISGTWIYEHWAFLPVTDGDLLRGLPSQQLLEGRVNGERMLSGHNADEGPMFVPQNITDEADFEDYIKTLLPLMNDTFLARVQSMHTIDPPTDGPRFSTLGDRGPTALNQSNFGIGHQQRANNLYAEAVFVCPSYWLATAFGLSNTTAGVRGHGAWKYQYSVPPAQHGADLDAYYGPDREALGAGTLSDAFRKGVQKMWGRFVMFDDPALPADVVANLTTTFDGSSTGDNITAGMIGTWPVWKVDKVPRQQVYQMLNLNMTGGYEVTVTETYGDGTEQSITQYAGPGLTADWAVVDAYNWEGGRGVRCQFWAYMGDFVPG